MVFKSWIDKVLSPLGAFGPGRPRGRTARAKQPRQRLRIEGLEGRCLPSAVVVTNSTDVTDGTTSSIAALISDPGADRTISLREAILASNSTRLSANSITFDPVTSGTPIRLTQGYLKITNALTITGLGAAHTTVDGKFLSLIVSIEPVGRFNDVGPVTFDGLKFTGGNGSDAGAIRSQLVPGAVLT